MTTTIPPDGKSAQIEADAQAPRLKPEEYPLAVLWQVDYRDGVRKRGICLVHSQAAMNGLYRLLGFERAVTKAQVNLKFMRCDNLSIYPRLEKLCDEANHNRPDVAQGNYCYECGKLTRLARIVEDE
ncbi:hypothetical protein HZC53_04670 [Candidatus Uhrbacteria bacterium]|nr:hypothetical protein [Candidatus Uhrbacteria bacterium]